MLRILYERGINTFQSGVGEMIELNKIEGTHYYGTSDIENPKSEWLFNFIGTDEITLCPGCYMWSSFTHPDYQKSFIELNSMEMGYRQWLDEYEDKLIVED